MSTPMFRYTLKENYAYNKVKFVCGQTSAEVRVAPHSIFSQVKQINLKVDQFNTKFLELAQKGQVLISPEKSNEFVKRSNQVFNSQVQLDVFQVGVSLMLSNNDRDTKILDLLAFKDLLAIVAAAFDKTGIKLHSKVIRKLKSYTKNSTRQQSQKQILQTISKSYKQSQNLYEEAEQDQIPTSQKKQSRKQQKTTYKKVEDNSTQNLKKQALNVSKKTENKQTNDVDNLKPSEDDQQEQNSQQVKDVVPKRSNMDRKGKKAQSGRNYTPREQQEVQQYSTKNRPSSRSGNKRNNNYNRSSDKRNDFRGSSTSKQKVDPKIMLGITGDTQFGWRQRNRPTRYPARNQLNVDDDEYMAQTTSEKTRYKKPDNYQKYSNTSKSSKDSRDQTSKNQKSAKYEEAKGRKQPTQTTVTTQVIQKNVEQQSSNSFAEAGQAKLIFTYPKNGTKFDFKKLKNNFMLFINGSFWVKYTQGTLSITKGENGYIRESKIDFLDNGLMGEGLTLTLDGNSNIQDGGDTIGTPTIDQFTGGTSQFFHIATLQVYVPK